MAGGVGTMGRPRTKRGAQPPEDKGERETVIHMKGSPEYVAWLDQIHKRTHIPKVQIVRLALADWAQRNGHSAPPEI